MRHGETNWNAEGRYQGSREILNDRRGRGQADLNGDLLRRLLARAGRLPTDFSWYFSPLSRTRETMDRIRARIGEPPPDVTVDPRLTEISFGIYEGHLHADLAAGAMAIAGERDADFWYFRPPEGESYDDVAHRVADFGASLPGPAAVVAHGGILRILRRLIEDFADRAVNWFPPQDCVVHFTNRRAVVYPAGQSWDD